MIIIGGFSNNKYSNDIYGFNFKTLKWRIIYKSGSNLI